MPDWAVLITGGSAGGWTSPRWAPTVAGRGLAVPVRDVDRVGRRVRAQIVHQVGDAGGCAAAPAIAQLPADFAGREPQTAQLVEALTAGGGPGRPPIAMVKRATASLAALDV
jgi:hypothetical protein